MIATQPAAHPDLAPALEGCFFFPALESSYEISGVQGRVPEWLRGTWYVNGPACFERAGFRYNHWLDGDGMVCALHFGDESIRFTNRFVRTPKFNEEESAGRFLYRAFGTTFAGDRLRRNVMLEPPVNVSVYPYAGRLLAFGEQSLPYELHPATLETVGEYDFQGAINEVTPFAAHPKCDGGLLNFGVSFSPTHPTLNVYEFDALGALLRRRRYPLALQHSLHDFGFTPRHIVFFLSPLLMNFSQFWSGGASVMESLEWRPELGSRLFIAPRIGSADEPFAVDVNEGYCLHVINCFERGGHLIVDVLLLDSPAYPEYQPLPNLFETAPAGRPVRYLIDIESRRLLETRMLEYNLAQDFPAVDAHCAGRPYDHFWMLGMSKRGRRGRKFFDQLAHGNWNEQPVSDIFQTAPGEYLCAEPCFIANPNDPSEAVVICEHLKPNEHASAILIFDAFQVGRGPVASIPLRFAIHPGFHTTFAPGTGAR
jgi:all-trans-8'-apo-beta-carotenal 15,15'-oxygenase